MLSTNKKILFIIIIISISLFIGIISCEIIVRFISPQALFYPRWQFSPEYYFVLPVNTRIRHSLSKRWQFIYTINAYGYRGPLVDISNKYYKKNIVVLGDSYAFGTGVNDGEEFPAIMQKILSEDYDVINLACGGYGLAQEIRRYYEFGELYLPRIVILQYCENDLEDNIFCPVTEIIDGRFNFKNSTNRLHWTHILLSNPIVQNSQLYSYIRKIRYMHSRKLLIGNNLSILENNYNALLDMFAKDLHNKGIKLIFISVNGHLEAYPKIINCIKNLEKQKAITYIAVEPWFENIKDYGTPEGHQWGLKAHSIIGRKLAKYIIDKGY